MEVTDIGNKEEGKVLVTVVRTAQQAKIVRFLHVTFDTQGTPSWLEINMATSTFRLVQKTGQACTALAFSLRRTTEFLVALADYTINSGRYAISTSSDTAQLWDMDTFERKRKLNIRQSVGIQRVFFLPLSNTILSCFSDDSIFAWESDTLSCKYQLPVPDCGPKVSYKAFAVTRDGKSLAAGGRSNLLHLWCLDSKQLIRVIQMPTQVRTVRQLDFLPDSFDGGASQDGVMRFINIHTCKLLFHMGSHDDAITTATVSPNGRHVVAIMDNGSINVYSVQSLTQELNKVANELPGLNKKRLVALLKGFGEYPAKYRMFVWRSLLCLPENHAAYSSLTDKGLHSAYLTLQDKYPIKSHKLQRGLQRVLSALAHWAAIFGEVEYLPLVAFPFVKLFQNNPMLCFEVVATVIVNWGQHWFEYFPNPPLNILSMAENVLAHHDKELLQHLVDCGITSQLYVWPLLETLFSEVLTREEWLRLFDNIFSNHPSFLLLACVAYITCCREPLLLCSQKEDFEELLQNAEEEQRRNILAQEEEKLTQQRTKLAAMKRELKVKELQLLDATKRRFLKHQQDLRASQVQRLDQEINGSPERETATAVQDLEVRQMELEAQRKRLEQHLFKEQERVGREVEEEVEMKMRKAEREEENYTELLHHTETNMQALEESLAEACQLGLESDWQREVGGRLQQVHAQQQSNRGRLAESHRQTLAEEERLEDTMREVAGRKWDEVMNSRAQLQEQPLSSAETDVRRQMRVVSPPHRPIPAPSVSAGPSAAGPDVRPGPAPPLKQAQTNMVCLNSRSPSESTSTVFSLDRGRAHLDSSERNLMKEIRELRQKLAARAREDGSSPDTLCPPSPSDTLCPPSPSDTLCPPSPSDTLCPPSPSDTLSSVSQ
ncbi:hypothetical protein F7725_018829 [Dissostichus mawsoni]|uniref:TBC1 domain family member 31 n=1 Tax=Dissostichus mawsoni TaxID=36200 RepID=A0A7J5XSQ4_DISMA|nr:hypothetical protein F7725_018829 [Dissostichus mawsoni]